jgi:hypothetical protein
MSKSWGDKMAIYNKIALILQAIKELNDIKLKRNLQQFLVAMILNICLLLLPSAVYAQDDLLNMFEEPSFTFNLPKPLLVAISHVESRIRPWTLNINGEAKFFDSKEKTLDAVRSAFLSGYSVDLGLMQINSYWLNKYGISPEAALDPLANIYFGTWILSQEYKRLGDLKAAIGSYHSPNLSKANHYRDVVIGTLQKGIPKPDLKKNHVSISEVPKEKKIEAPKSKISLNESGNQPTDNPAVSPMLVRSQSKVLVSTSTMLSTNDETMKIKF